MNYIHNLLITFNCPQNLKKRFDEICKKRNVSKTALLIQFIEREVQEWERRLNHSVLTHSNRSPISPADKWSIVEDFDKNYYSEQDY